MGQFDPERPESLNATQRGRKARLLESVLSDYYVGLCFEGFSTGVISIGGIQRHMEFLLERRANGVESRRTVQRQGQDRAFFDIENILVVHGSLQAGTPTRSRPLRRREA